MKKIFFFVIIAIFAICVLYWAGTYMKGEQGIGESQGFAQIPFIGEDFAVLAYNGKVNYSYIQNSAVRRVLFTALSVDKKKFLSFCNELDCKPLYELYEFYEKWPERLKLYNVSMNDYPHAQTEDEVIMFEIQDSNGYTIKLSYSSSSSMLLGEAVLWLR